MSDMSAPGGAPKPDDALPGETREQYEARKRLLEAACSSAEQQQRDLDGLEIVLKDDPAFRTRQAAIVSSLRMLQQGRPSLSDRAGAAFDKWKEPVVQVAYDAAGLVLFSDLNDLPIGDMKHNIPWAFHQTNLPLKKQRIQQASQPPLQPPTDEDHRKKFIDCVEQLLKQTLADGIYSPTAIPKAIFQMGFDESFLAVGAAIGTSFLLRWAGWKLLTGIGQQLIGTISFGRLTLGEVVTAFQGVLSSPQDTISEAFRGVLEQFGVPENLRSAYIAAVANYAYDQLQTVISTIAVTSISIAFGTRLSPFHQEFVDAAGNLVNLKS